MLAIHWSPVKNTKRIKKNGIRKNKNGLYCFPLTGNQYVDKFWVDLFNSSKKNEFNGFIFRLGEDDMPSYLGDWLGATSNNKFDKEIKDLKSLKTEFRNNFFSKLGQCLSYERDDFQEINESGFIAIAEEHIQKESISLSKVLSDILFLDWSMKHLQLVTSNSVSANRILKIISQSDVTGRVKRAQTRDKISLKEMKGDMNYD